MSRSSSESSLSSNILKESHEEDDSRNDSQMHLPRSQARGPQRSSRGNTTSRLQSGNVERKRILKEASLSPEMSPRKMSRPESEKISSSTEPQESASPAGRAVAMRRISFWSSPRRKEAASDSPSPSVVQSGRKSAPEQESADGFTRAVQRQSDSHLHLSTSDKQKSMKMQSLDSFGTPSSSPRITKDEKAAVKVRPLQQKPVLRARRTKKQMKPVKRTTGYKVLRGMRHHQSPASSSMTLIPRLPFSRVVREVLFSVGGKDFRMQKLALSVLQETSEAIIVAVLQGANVLAHHSRRVTLMNRDLDTFLALIRNNGSLQRCLS